MLFIASCCAQASTPLGFDLFTWPLFTENSCNTCTDTHSLFSTLVPTPINRLDSNLLRQNILELNSSCRKRRNTVRQLVDRHGVLIELEAEFWLVVEIALSLDV